MHLDLKEVEQTLKKITHSTRLAEAIIAISVSLFMVVAAGFITYYSFTKL